MAEKVSFVARPPRMAGSLSVAGMLMKCLQVKLLLLTIVSCSSYVEVDREITLDWLYVAGDAGGGRHSQATQITPGNVHELRIAWQVRLGEAYAEASLLDPASSTDSGFCRSCVQRTARAEATPLVWQGTLYVSTPTGRVVALDATQGQVRWSFDPRIDLTKEYPEGLTNRGLALWISMDHEANENLCESAIFSVSVDSRLHALDARSGRRCIAFGDSGQIDLLAQVVMKQEALDGRSHSTTSPPVVVGDVVIVGSSVTGNRSPPTATGAVQAFDVRSGRRLWTFDAVPRSRQSRFRSDWDTTRLADVSGGNVWSLMSADVKRGHVFLPTAGPLPNHVGVNRVGRNAPANSIVALNASTGELLWSFQTVYHDLWDYDVASQPVLVDSGSSQVVIALNKAGMVFVLHQKTGAPISNAAVVAAPRSFVPGEESWPVQLVSGRGPLLHEGLLTIDSMFGISSDDLASCRRWFSRLRYDGLYTPPSSEGSISWPGVWGGPNWDGASWDPDRQLLFVTVRRIATVLQVDLHETFAKGSAAPPQRHREYRVLREPFVSPSGVPCTPPPWSALVAVDPFRGTVVWSSPLGRVPSLEGNRSSVAWGSLAFGGSLSTASGLVFVAASQDDRIRAFDATSGRVLWEHELPAGGQAVPMTFAANGKQFIAILAGGRAGIGSSGDWVVAFALPHTAP